MNAIACSTEADSALTSAPRMALPAMTKVSCIISDATSNGAPACHVASLAPMHAVIVSTSWPTR
jgi:hypothetical protein